MVVKKTNKNETSVTIFIKPTECIKKILKLFLHLLLIIQFVKLVGNKINK